MCVLCLSPRACQVDLRAVPPASLPTSSTTGAQRTLWDGYSSVEVHKYACCGDVCVTSWREGTVHGGVEGRCCPSLYMLQPSRPLTAVVTIHTVTGTTPAKRAGTGMNAPASMLLRPSTPTLAFARLCPPLLPPSLRMTQAVAAGDGAAARANAATATGRWELRWVMGRGRCSCRLFLFCFRVCRHLRPSSWTMAPPACMCVHCCCCTACYLCQLPTLWSLACGMDSMENEEKGWGKAAHLPHLHL